MPSAATHRKSPPKQARSAAKRDAILDTVEDMLAQHTPSDITTRSVAEAAEVPIGSVYRYFSDADDLLLSLFERMNAGTVGLLRAQLEQAPPLDWRTQVDRTFGHLAKMHAGHPAYGALQAHLGRDAEDAEIAGLLDGLIRRDAPQLSHDLARQVARTVMAIIDGVERQLPSLSPGQRNAALDQARLAVTTYLAHHLEGGA